MEDPSSERSLVLNILFLNSSKTRGGNEKWLCMAAESLAERNCRVFCALRDNSVGKKLQKPEVKILPFRHEADPATLLPLIRLIRREKIDAVISTKQKDYFIGGLLSRILGTRHYIRMGIERKIDDKTIKKFIFNRLCDGIIVNSKKIREGLCAKGSVNENKVKVIYNGVEPALKAEISPAEKPFPFTVSSSGSLIKRKGFVNVILSFAEFIKKYDADDAGLVIIGDGLQKKKLCEIAKKKGIADKIIFTGFLEDPYPVLKSSDVFLFLSENEGLPNSVIEAMYLENACIAASTAGCGEFIRNDYNGYMVSRDDYYEIAGKLIFLKNHPEKLKKMQTNAAKTAEEKFDIEKMAEELAGFVSERH
ncbi:MAG: glycosyltransferase [Fibrobacterota bacterium]